MGVDTRHGHDAGAGAPTSPAARIRGRIPARSSDDFPAADTPSRPAPVNSRAIRSSTWAVGLAAEEERRVLLPERAQPAVGRNGPGRWRPAVDSRQRRCGRSPPPRRRHEQFPSWPGQAQRPSQQQRGVLAGGAVDPPLQVADRPRERPAAFASSSWVSWPPPGAAVTARRKKAKAAPPRPHAPTIPWPSASEVRRGPCANGKPARTSTLSPATWAKPWVFLWAVTCGEHPGHRPLWQRWPTTPAPGARSGDQPHSTHPKGGAPDAR
jgi:hypothetical protein